MGWLREAIGTWRGRLDRRRTLFMYIFACLPAYLFLILASILRLGVVEYRLGGESTLGLVDSAILWVFALAIILPLSSVFARRLHDVGLVAKWVLAPFALAFFVACVFWTRPEIKDTWIGPSLNWSLLAFAAFLLLWPGQKGDNRFGPSGRRY